MEIEPISDYELSQAFVIAAIFQRSSAHFYWLSSLLKRLLYLLRYYSNFILI